MGLAFAHMAAALAATSVLACGSSPEVSSPLAAPDEDGGARAEAGTRLPDGSLSAGDAAWSTGPASCACTLTVPDGFERVAYLDRRTTACPVDMTQIDLVTDATVEAGACACGTCAVGTVPDCNAGTFSSTYDDTATPTCDAAAISHPCNAGKCTAYSGSMGQHGRAVPPTAPGGGTCSARGIVKTSNAPSTPARACAESATRCACDPAVPGAFTTCLRAPGDVPCPTAAPLKHLVGTSAAVACGDCSCTLTATCTGSVTFYSDAACATSIVTITDAACTTEGPGSYAAYKWAGTTATSCTLGTSAATAALTDESTICCP
jgi:hypothetical protein